MSKPKPNSRACVLRWFSSVAVEGLSPYFGLKKPF